MKNARLIAVAAILAFAWRGEIGLKVWPPKDDPAAVDKSRPDDEALGWAAGINVANMTPADRLYSADFYRAVGFILANDSKQRVIKSTQEFSVFHAGSLNLAIDRGSVGRYPGLGASIDRAFFAAAGDTDDKPLDPATAEKFVRCSNAIAWRFSIHADE